MATIEQLLYQTDKSSHGSLQKKLFRKNFPIFLGKQLY